jgi:HEAT repeat protein
LWSAARQTAADLQDLERAGGTSVDGLASIARGRDKDRRLRLQAIWILARLESSGAFEPLVAALGDPQAPIRGEAAAGLGILNDDRGVAHLIRTLETDSDAAVRKQAAYGLGLLCGGEALVVLKRVLASQREEAGVRGMAAESLGSCFAREALPELIRALSDGSDEVRFWAAHALGFMKAKAALPELKRLADTDHAEVEGWGRVSVEAAQAIAQITGKQRDSSA